MKLTPLDVVQRTFESKMRGFDPGEVRGFLKEISDAMEELVRENKRLEDLLRQRDGDLDAYREREGALRDALVSAQKMRDEMQRQSRKDAEQVLAEAELEAERILHNAEQRRNEVLDEVRELKVQRTRFESELKGVIGTHLSILKARREAASARSEGEGDPRKVRVLRPRRKEAEGQGPEAATEDRRAGA